ncbi:porphobilinogen synthase [Paraclostridium bifermentans]|jgi:porphobilinogen synthase|uniref:Delta-aminolevulinic acid dehydratase n=1 Tax=Paraclostridium bifermentans ATCC 638 = DSM 14991 TaxID=1233171 RepID=T4W011_PARBF|nr:porphobilinogen synthase [Paraclostridium bifermentans]MDU7904367.1 porphobilinogen synthase [Peptostreptococcaceae bacterium]RDC50496.1 porphobilinogen synthase [Acinetobacter sp. RIT592]EQK46267.1 delta-aminolevulinic acid dehydratase family protein [[Clostridium] bifermentans ATCC 638] [Paraclostridium bifermentans ATCC 638 = DSM 14991]MBS5954933.1 porphobilinogen synthase [Paraclostridium bifermentans]MBS6509916.1 porphobilinogen synthase [Paraclostridium bifermentans]
MLRRPRRLRKSAAIRDLVRETVLNVNDLIYPLFVVEGENIKEEIPSLPEVYHFSLDKLEEEIKEIKDLGIQHVILFGIPDEKDPFGKEAYNDNGIVQKAIRKIKEIDPDMCVTTDVCMCQYTSHGHCGILTEKGYVDNDQTLEYLTKIAVSHAKAGADMVAPSDMMDGRIQAMREGLDAQGFETVAIMSYSVKYASSFYGPFRDAAGSAPSFGDRKTYQMDPANSNEALIEAELDVLEGADMLMVKPALSYLDVIRRVKDNFDLPLVAYNVSGEYSMLKLAVKEGLLNESAIYEAVMSIKRAGADIIITYFAKDIAKLIRG